MKKILFITPYPTGVAGSQRFRFEQYFEILKDHGFQYEVSPFLDNSTWKILYEKGHLFKKLASIITGSLTRFWDVIRMSRYDIIFVHREAFPFGPPIFEWLFLKASGKHTVFDLDDAIWLTNPSESNWIAAYLKRNSNALNCFKWASVVSAGNRLLAEEAGMYNKNVIVNPTTAPPPPKGGITGTSNPNARALESPSFGGVGEAFAIGWIGSHSTVQYLDELYPVFLELEKKFSFEVHVICDTPPKFKLASLRFIKWSKGAEAEEAKKLTIGVMPLPDNEWTRGKCGFKAIQYMASGIPAVVSDVGVNSEIVDHDINGCVCRTKEDWIFYLSKLMSDNEYLAKLSSNTRAKINAKYSVVSNTENFLSLFNFDKKSA